MKTFKRIMAVVLAVMLIASIGAITASAAAPSLTIDASGADAQGFTFDIYRIATLNTTTGKYTCVNNDVAAVVNTANQSGADFLAAVQGLASQNKLGSPIKNDLKETTYSATTAGIYYVKVDGTPENPTLKKDSVIVWPEAADDGTYTMADLTVDLSEKVSSSPVRVTKAFAVNDEASKSLGEVAGTDTVDFLLTASVAGSSAKPASEYYIWDKMSKGLTYDKSSVKVYSDAALQNDITSQFTVSEGSAITDNDAYKGGTYFTVTPNDLTATSQFYTWSTIYVKYTATLNTDAVVAPASNPNKDGLHAVVDGQQIDKDGQVREVYTYNLKIKKTKGDTDEGLQGAKFDLMLNGSVIASGESDGDGIVEFFAEGETVPIKLAPSGNGVVYTVVETEAPDGYALNTDVKTVTISDTKGSTTAYADLAPAISVPNYATKLPETGGIGTKWFTIGGIALILAAAVMFVIIMKKKSSAK